MQLPSFNDSKLRNFASPILFSIKKMRWVPPREEVSSAYFGGQDSWDWLYALMLKLILTLVYISVTHFPHCRNTATCPEKG